MSFLLRHRSVRGERSEADDAQTVWLLHGALGSGQNWISFAKRWVERRPQLHCLLVDLRHHGGSRGAPPPNTLAQCAQELRDLAQHLGEGPQVLVGHSFGGKVALQYVADWQGSADAAAVLRQAWALDSVPGIQAEPDDSEITRVLAALASVSTPASSRSAVVTGLTEAGLSRGIANWLATNLERTEDGRYRWAVDFAAIGELVADYFKRDLWPILEATQRPHGAPELHLVLAERSDRWTPEGRARSQAAASATTHVLRDAGHWVHVDNPDGLLEILLAHTGI